MPRPKAVKSGLVGGPRRHGSATSHISSRGCQTAPGRPFRAILGLLVCLKEML